MNKETIKGATQQRVGEAQEGIGKAAHDNKLVAKGLANRGAGAAKETAGKVKTAVKKAVS
jgi:uncharacterized protein YjbJ (UPF0337 family)